MKKEWLKKLKKFWNKFYFIVWKDDSLKGWIISLIFIFVLIKFIFFPLMSFFTGTALPLAIVESCSMHHNENLLSNYNDWWNNNKEKYKKFNITKKDFSEFSFKKGFTKGDILLITKAEPENLKKGDIIIFQTNKKHPLIHRIVNITNTSEGYIFSTLGDNNSEQLSIEKEIHKTQLIGKAKFKLIPYAGWIKLIFYEPFQPDYNKGFC
ncbi:MAG: signal peptidase I [Nanoarchaeota archaeon]